MSRAPFANEDAYDTVIRIAASNYGVPFSLVKAIIGQESRFDPRAYRVEAKINDASRGLMQILLGTAQGQGFSGTAEDLFDPLTNITYGTSYLARQINRAGNIEAGVSAYNGGYNPTVGFGARVTAPVRVCLRRDTKGNCIEYRNVPVGEYANQSYVNDVLYNYAYYEKKAGASPPAVIASTPPPLDTAHLHTESEVGGRTSGVASNPTRTHTPLADSLKWILQWLYRLLHRTRR